MPRQEVTGKKAQNLRAEDHALPRGLPPVVRAAYSIREFCCAYRISEDMFFKMARQGQAPRVMKVGTRTLISVAAAQDWEKEREAIGGRDLAF